MSAAGRARIAAAQKLRWAKLRKGGPKVAKRRNKMSAAGRARIAAAARARWAAAKAAGRSTLGGWGESLRSNLGVRAWKQANTCHQIDRGDSVEELKLGLLSNIAGVVGRRVPDAMVERVAREFFNRSYKSVGTLTGLKLDAKNQRAELVFELKGEPEPLHVSIDRYELSEVGGKTFVAIKEFKASREWIDALGRRLLAGRKFELPEAVKALL
jgi:hypothetical protein